jgi:hypothetical protein
VTAPDRQQPDGDRVVRNPMAHAFGDIDEALTVGPNRQPMHCLAHDKDLCLTG